MSDNAIWQLSYLSLLITIEVIDDAEESPRRVLRLGARVGGTRSALSPFGTSSLIVPSGCLTLGATRIQGVMREAKGLAE